VPIDERVITDCALPPTAADATAQPVVASVTNAQIVESYISGALLHVIFNAVFDQPKTSMARRRAPVASFERHKHTLAADGRSALFLSCRATARNPHQKLGSDADSERTEERLHTLDSATSPFG
jgi:hypothetical protein